MFGSFLLRKIFDEEFHLSSIWDNFHKSSKDFFFFISFNSTESHKNIFLEFLDIAVFKAGFSLSRVHLCVV
jgi:hypothetical protein